MATTTSLRYKDDDPRDFQKRMYATLNAQSIAIAAALALAAKGSEQGDERALNLMHALIREMDSKERIFPVDERDRGFSLEHLAQIFTEAEKLLKTKSPDR